MSIYKQTGPNRLAKFITVAAFVVTYVTLYAINNPTVIRGMVRGPSSENIFIVFPFQSAMVAVVTFWVMRFVYWVIDGFIGRNSSDEKLNYPD